MLLLMTSCHKIARSKWETGESVADFFGDQLWDGNRPGIVLKETEIVPRIPGIVGIRTRPVSRLLTLGCLLRALSSELAPMITFIGATTAARNSNSI